MEKAFYLKRSLWGGLAIAVGLFALSYAPLPDTKTVLQGLAGLAVVCALALAWSSDTV